MQGELRAAVAELESALLEIKRARILEHLTASMSGVGSSGGGAPPPHTILPAATAAAPESCGAVLPPPGSLCHFRYMDGRWYYGLVQGPGRQVRRSPPPGCPGRQVRRSPPWGPGPP